MARPTLHYHREGTGSPLVLLHGIGATWQCFLPILPALAASHDVIAIDLPGFGGSVDLGTPAPSLDSLATAVIELLSELGIGQFHLVGSSLGGGVGLSLLRTGRVLSYTGISSAGQSHGRYRVITHALLRSVYNGSRLIAPVARPLLRFRAMRALLLGSILGRPSAATPNYANELVQGCAIGAGFAPTLRHAVPRRSVVPPESYVGPAQMLWGTRDLVLPLWALGRWSAVWPALRLVPLAGLGHLPMSDDPELVAALILDVTTAADRSAAAPAA